MANPVQSNSSTQNTQFNNTQEASTDPQLIDLLMAVFNEINASNLINAAGSAVTNATRGLNTPTPPKPMSRQEIEKELDEWVSSDLSNSNFYSIQIRDMILEAYSTQATSFSKG